MKSENQHTLAASRAIHQFLVDAYASVRSNPLVDDTMDMLAVDLAPLSSAAITAIKGVIEYVAAVNIAEYNANQQKLTIIDYAKNTAAKEARKGKHRAFTSIH